jgi:hypothetical protein
MVGLVTRGQLERAKQLVLGPTDAIVLRTFRYVFLISLLLYLAAWWTHAGEWLSTAGFHVDTADANPALPSPATPLPPGFVPVLGAVLFGAILLALADQWVRMSLAVTLGLVIYVTYVDLASAFTINILYIAGLAVLVVAPRSRIVRDGNQVMHVQSVWPVRILQATLLILYFNCGLGKAVFGDWLKSPDVFFSQIQGPYRSGLACWLIANLPLRAWTAMQVVTLWFELFAPVLFMVRRFRPLALVIGIGLHLGIALTMHKLIYFSFQVVCFYILFVNASTLHRIEATLRSRALSIGIAIRRPLRRGQQA